MNLLPFLASTAAADFGRLERRANRYLNVFSLKNYYIVAALKGFRNGIV